jgi:hypothetical protein
VSGNRIKTRGDSKDSVVVLGFRLFDSLCLEDSRDNFNILLKAKEASSKEVGRGNSLSSLSKRN